LNRKHQLLVYADDVNILGESKNTEDLVDVSGDVGLELNTIWLCIATRMKDKIIIY